MELEEFIRVGNKLIAEFMGCSLKSYPTAMKTPFHGQSVWWSAASKSGTRTFWCIEGEEHYHDSWEWLMEVVDKIGNIGYDFKISRSWSEIRVTANSKNGMFEMSTGHSARGGKRTKIEATYFIAVEFIKWYNNQIS